MVSKEKAVKMVELVAGLLMTPRTGIKFCTCGYGFHSWIDRMELTPQKKKELLQLLRKMRNKPKESDCCYPIEMVIEALFEVL